VKSLLGWRDHFRMKQKLFDPKPFHNICQMCPNGSYIYLLTIWQTLPLQTSPTMHWLCALWVKVRKPCCGAGMMMKLAASRRLVQREKGYEVPDENRDFQRRDLWWPTFALVLKEVLCQWLVPGDNIKLCRALSQARPPIFLYFLTRITANSD
jgi:hypothetical protein